MITEFRIATVRSEQQYLQVRQLILEYAASRNFDAALANIYTELDQLASYYPLILLAYRKDTPAGCVAIQVLEEGICEMKRLYVTPPFRKLGLGKQLVHQLLEEATKMGFQRMRLDTHPKMHGAHKLYQSLGFREIARYNQNPIPGIRFFELQLNPGV